MSELSLGGPQDGSANLDNCMSNYQWAKKQRKNAENKGNEKRAQKASGDMVYWEQMMLAYGAISLEMCALAGSSPIAPQWDDPAMVEQRDNATKAVAFLETQGAPWLDLDYHPVPAQ